MGGFQKQGTGVGVGMGRLHDHGSQMISDNIFDDDAYFAASTYVSSTDASPFLGDGGAEENNTEYENDYPTGYPYSCLTPETSCNFFHEVNVHHEDPPATCDPLWQQLHFPSSQSSLDFAGASSTFEESQAAPVAQLLRSGTTVQAEQLQTPIGQVLSQSVLLSPSESYAESYKESVAKRPRISCCAYTMEDVIKNLPRGCESSVGSNKNWPRNISPVASQIPSGFNITSPGLSWSSVSSSLEKDSSEKTQTEYQRYRYTTTRLSVEPHSVAARLRRRKIQEKTGCLEKLIPLRSKVDTAKMLEEAAKYVKFLQAQVHVLECMPSSLSRSHDLRSARTINPSTQDSIKLLSTLSPFVERGGIRAKAKLDSVPKSLEQQTFGENLSVQQMLHVLLTSREIQGNIFSKEQCVGTTQQYEKLTAAKRF